MKNRIYNIFLSIFIGISLSINLGLFKNLDKVTYELFSGINVFGSLCISFVIYYLLSKDKIISSNKLNKSKKVLSFIFALFMLLGECYVSASTFKLVFENFYTIIFSISKLIGYYYLFNILFILLSKFINNIKIPDKSFKNKHIKAFMNIFDKHPFIVSFILLFLVLSIYMIAFYPIVLSPDPSFQIKMYFNEPTKYINWTIQRDPNVFMTAHHPITQTFLIGWCIDLGRIILNDNFGLFIYTFLQSIIYLSVLAYTIKFMKDNEVNVRLRFGILLLYLFVPMYLFYSVSAVKDTLYTAFLILFTLKVYDIVKNYKDNNIKTNTLITLYFIMMLVSLFRHNGVYVITLSIIALVLFSKKNAIKLLITFGLFFVSITAFDNVLVPSLGISPGSVREMLSIPFQQTARLVKEKKNFYNEKDKKKINKVIKYNTLAERYNPELADPVKNKYNPKATKKDLAKYFTVWLKGFKRIDIYIDATMNNTYGFFYPNKHYWYFYSKYDDRVTQNDLVDYHYNNLEGLRDVLNSYANIFPYIPIIGLISNIAVNSWVLFILTIYLLDKKVRKYIISLIPLYGSLIFCVLGPANTYFRYAMPYMFILPVLIVLLLGEIKKNKIEV